MKQFFLSLLLLVLTTAIWAQAPNLVNYQAVARNSSGQALANQTIKIRIGLNQVDNSSAVTFFSEIRTVTTNALGLFNVQIGGPGAESQTGNINNTNWLDNSKTRSISVGLDLNNGYNFTDMGNQQLVSVPYAMAANTAKTAEKLSGPFVGFSGERYNIQNLGTSNATLTYDAEYIDSTNNFDPATGKFTAPETGIYFLSFSGNIYSASATNNVGAIGFRNTNGNILALSSDALYFKLDNQRPVTNYSQIVRLSAGETVEVYVQRVTGSDTWFSHASTFIGYKLK